MQKMMNKYLKKLLLLCFGIFNITCVFAETIAICGEPKGHSYYPDVLEDAKYKSQWIKDTISGGIFELDIDDNQFDIVYVDVASQTRVSWRTMGAEVIPFAMTDNQIGILAVKEGKSVETFNFYKELSGKNTYSITKSKVGNEFPSASVMTGDCSYINWEKV